MNVPHPDYPLVPKKVDTIEAAVEPQGFPETGVSILQTGHRGRRSHFVFGSEPFARIGEGHHVHLAALAEGSNLGNLHLKPFLHIGPGEGVLLAGLGVVEAEGGSFEYGVEENIHPPLVRTGAAIDGLQGHYALAVAGKAHVILVDGIASEHPEDGNRYLSLDRLGRHVGVQAAGIISLVPVPSPEGVTVSAILVLAVAGGLDAVFVIHVAKGMGIDEP